MKEKIKKIIAILRGKRLPAVAKYSFESKVKFEDLPVNEWLWLHTYVNIDEVGQTWLERTDICVMKDGGTKSLIFAGDLEDIKIADENEN